MKITKFIGIFLMMCIFIQCNNSNENLSVPSAEEYITDNTKTETQVIELAEQPNIEMAISFFSKTQRENDAMDVNESIGFFPVGDDVYFTINIKTINNNMNSKNQPIYAEIFVPRNPNLSISFSEGQLDNELLGKEVIYRIPIQVSHTAIENKYVLKLNAKKAVVEKITLKFDDSLKQYNTIKTIEFKNKGLFEKIGDGMSDIF